MALLCCCEGGGGMDRGAGLGEVGVKGGGEKGWPCCCCGGRVQW